MRKGFWAIILVTSFIIYTSCKSPSTHTPSKLFTLIPSSKSGIDFINKLDYTEELNTYTFKNFYNGGGVGLADINNDGLTDIFLCGNLVSNRLYLNQGNFKFSDITSKAGLISDGSWTTGVSIADINADGFLDIYICKSGPPGGERRHNELFINNGDLTFKEVSKEYGLDFIGLSTHAAFFDYDKDGDLDCYLLNNSIKSVGGYDLIKDQRKIPDPLGGNKLLRNDNNYFNDVSKESGIYTSAIGFGLGVTIGDINEDNWDDIFVSNDFFEKDYLYVNQKNGTFKESLEDYVNEISMGSMGADLADINNDGRPEIFVTEMLPESDDRLKTTAQFEKWDRYQFSVQNGYYKQFGRNVLQLNNGPGPDGQPTFSEISRLAGVDATDWSWGALIFDMDNDGLRDIFVANGIYKDLLDQDYINFIANQDVVRSIIQKKGNAIKQLIDSIPSNQISNFAFKNNGDLRFINKSEDWGLNTPSDSNGSAYADLDNDGDLDLVVNNVNSEVFIYKNNSSENKKYNWIQFKLVGQEKNINALGAKIFVYCDNETFYAENNPMRGFESTVDTKLTFGLGNRTKVDSAIIKWPDNRISVIKNPIINSVNSTDQASGVDRISPIRSTSKPLFIREENFSLNFFHQENDFVDFDRDRLIFNMVSNEGPCLCKGDINGDGLEDVYVGGAKDQAGTLFIQTKDGRYITSNVDVFEKDKDSEDTDCTFIDVNGDSKSDLYVTSGGNEYSSSSFALVDRLYINQGGGKLKRSNQVLPSFKFISSSTVSAADFDGDGDMDLFVGERLIPFTYGVPTNGYLLQNDGQGNFKDVTLEIAPGLMNVGQITHAEWADINSDQKPDLILIGEWMPVKIFLNDKGALKDISETSGLSYSNGWYHGLATGDFNNDGLVDLVVGNFGLNSRFKASKEEPVTMYVNDFDQNGSVEHILSRYYNGVSYPLVLKQDLVQQIPSLRKKYLRFESYKKQTIKDIFSPDQLQKSIVNYAYTFETAVWLNNGDNSFKKITLPIEAQFSPIYALLVNDFNGDDNEDILMGGNLYRAKPETGIYDGSYGLLILGDGKGNFKSLKANESGIQIKGEIRDFLTITPKGKTFVLVGINNEKLEVLRLNNIK